MCNKKAASNFKIPYGTLNNVFMVIVIIKEKFSLSTKKKQSNYTRVNVYPFGNEKNFSRRWIFYKSIMFNYGIVSWSIDLIQSLYVEMWRIENYHLLYVESFVNLRINKNIMKHILMDHCNYTFYIILVIINGNMWKNTHCWNILCSHSKYARVHSYM